MTGIMALCYLSTLRQKGTSLPLITRRKVSWIRILSCTRSDSLVWLADSSLTLPPHFLVERLSGDVWL